MTKTIVEEFVEYTRQHSPFVTADDLLILVTKNNVMMAELVELTARRNHELVDKLDKCAHERDAFRKASEWTLYDIAGDADRYPKAMEILEVVKYMVEDDTFSEPILMSGAMLFDRALHQREKYRYFYRVYNLPKVEHTYDS